MNINSEVTLRPVDRGNIDAILLLKLADGQEAHVAPNPFTLAQAAYYPEASWLRAIYINQSPAGLIAMKIWPELPKYYIWRMMIDIKFQGQGIGRLALKILGNEFKEQGVQQIVTRCVVDANSPFEFYKRCGFKITGKEEGNLVELKLDL